ncbi:MAG: MFS transporter [Fimbriimonadaceae bacterium]|nr:MFS transporter [Chitinophagales bacterium]
METITTTGNNKQFSSSYLYIVFAICFTGGVFGGVTSALMSSYLPVAVKDLLGNSAQENIDHVSAIINSMYLFGMLFGGLLLGIFGDRAGRKVSVLISIAFIGLFTLLTAFANDWWMVVACRFFSGFGVGGILVTSTILIAEEWTEKNRNIALGILSITIPVGIFSAGIITYFFEDWRKGFLIGIVPLLLSIIAQFTIRESEKWKQNRSERKTIAENKISIFNKTTLYDLIIGCVIYGTMLIGLWAIFSWLPTWVQTIVTNSDGQKERGISMMLFAIGGLSGGFISGWVSNYLGMKKTMILCFAATFIMSFILFKLNTTLSVFSYLEMAVIAIFFGISQGALNVYIPELFPTSIRSSATGFCFNIGRVFTASVVFFVGWLVNVLGGYGNALFIFSFIFLIGLITTFFAREKDLIQQ